MSSFKRVMGWYWRVRKPYNKQLTISNMLFPVAIMLDQLIAPLILGELFNKLGDQNTTTSSYVWLIVIYFLLTGPLSSFFFRVGMYFYNRGHSGLMRNAAKISFDNLINRDESFHANSFGGSLVAKSNRFARSLGMINGTIQFSIVTG